MICLDADTAEREHLIVHNGEIVVAHEYRVGGVIAVVAVRQVAVTIHVDIAVTGD